MIKKSKKEIMSEKVVEYQNDSKKLYAFVKDLTGGTVSNQLPRINGLSDDQIANNFADYFMSKIQNIRDGLKSFKKYEVPKRDIITSMDLLLPASESEVRNVIRKMAAKSCELDSNLTKILKLHLDIFLLELEHRVFVQNWKTAITRPLLKKFGLELIEKNYRPVSNLNFLSKVLEKIVLARFDNHCHRNNLMPEYQSAYCEFHSCETALTKLQDDLLWNMENGNVTALVSMNLSVAFDTVDHDILLSVLHNYFGVEVISFKWFESYLRPRWCKVNIGDFYSTERKLDFSVAQGSCSGPVLYSCYASMIERIIPSGIDIHGYADDHCVKKRFIPQEDTEKLAIKSLEELL